MYKEIQVKQLIDQFAFFFSFTAYQPFRILFKAQQILDGKNLFFVSEYFINDLFR